MQKFVLSEVSNILNEETECCLVWDATNLCKRTSYPNQLVVARPVY